MSTIIPVLFIGAKNSRRLLSRYWLSSAFRREYNRLSAKSIHYSSHDHNRRPDASRPEFWYEDFPIALIGQRQSPININTDQCVLNNKELTLDPLLIEYPSIFNGLTLKNSKDLFYGWRVDIPYDLAARTSLSGGPLAHNYRLAQFHCHWGKNCSCGSEHTINGSYYSAEMHFVHWNADLFETPREALYSPNGLAVIAVFLQESDTENSELTKLCSLMNRVRYKGSRHVINEPINVSDLLPAERSYWTYLGSLTTPPLWESVTWILFKQPIACHTNQIDSFRQISYFNEADISTNDDCDISVEENVRPPQPLNNRKIIYVNKKSII